MNRELSVLLLCVSLFGFCAVEAAEKSGVSPDYLRDAFTLPSASPMLHVRLVSKGQEVTEEQLVAALKNPKMVQKRTQAVLKANGLPSVRDMLEVNWRAVEVGEPVQPARRLAPDEIRLSAARE